MPRSCRIQRPSLARVVTELRVKTLILPVRPQFYDRKHGRMSNQHLLDHRINIDDKGIDRYREVISLSKNKAVSHWAPFSLHALMPLYGAEHVGQESQLRRLPQRSKQPSTATFSRIRRSQLTCTGLWKRPRRATTAYVLGQTTTAQPRDLGHGRTAAPSRCSRSW